MKRETRTMFAIANWDWTSPAVSMSKCRGEKEDRMDETWNQIELFSSFVRWFNFYRSHAPVHCKSGYKIHHMKLLQQQSHRTARLDWQCYRFHGNSSSATITTSNMKTKRKNLAFFYEYAITNSIFRFDSFQLTTAFFPPCTVPVWPVARVAAIRQSMRALVHCVSIMHSSKNHF